MGIWKSVSLVLLLQISLFSQNFLERELQRIQNKPGLKFNSLNDSLLTLSCYDRYTRTYNLRSSSPKNPSSDTVPTWVFDLFSLDTTNYYNKFRFDQEVDIGTSAYNLLIGDISGNSRMEYYGIKKPFGGDWSRVYCYEQNNAGRFQYKYRYETSTIDAYNIYDVDRDGQEELHLMAMHGDSIPPCFAIYDMNFYKRNNVNYLPTIPYFNFHIYHGLASEIDNLTFGDFDQDNITECIYVVYSPRRIQISKFNSLSLCFDSVFTEEIPDDGASFTVGDFDQDGSTDILFSDIMGGIKVLEYENNTYVDRWNYTCDTYNLHINFWTNDINNNGIPEFWVIGQMIMSGFVRLFGFESSGDNDYRLIYKIEIPGISSLIYQQHGQAFDVDNDGKDELFFHNNNTVVVLKFSGTEKEPDFKIYYYKFFPFACDFARLCRFPNELYPTLALSMWENTIDDSRLFSWIMKHYLITGIEDVNSEQVITGYNLSDNFPNPFNPSTSVKVSVPERSNVSLKIFNSLGEEVITLINNNSLDKGEHTITWNGKDKYNISIPSGVYFIRMEAESFHKTIKCMLIK